MPIVLALLSPWLSAAHADEPLLSGEKLQQKLESPLLVSFENIPLRDVLAQIQTAQQISVILDRHLDPEQVVTLAGGGKTLREFLEALAKTISAKASFLESAVYLGPRERAEKLRTLIKMRSDEIQKLPFDRRAAWLRKQDYRWNYLDEPREVLTQLVALTEMSCDDQNLIEHDLWRAAELPETTLVEVLSVILVQFDFTWGLNSAANSIELTPLPRDVDFEKTYSLRRNQQPEQLKAQAPGVKFTPNGRRITVMGTVEDHELVEAFINGKLARQPNAAEVLPLARRRFTLTVEGIPASAVIKKLEESGLQFDYDDEALQRSNISLDAKVKIDVKDATAEEFFEALFAPLGLDVALEDVTIRLSPKK